MFLIGVGLEKRNIYFPLHKYGLRNIEHFLDKVNFGFYEIYTNTLVSYEFDLGLDIC